jgi:predicted  nucleic acid-binding Zn-ribbon protein
MSSRDLKILIELQDNYIKIQEYQSLIEAQQKRVLHLKKQIALKSESSQELLLKQKAIIAVLNQGENQLAAKEKTLKQAESHSLAVTKEKQAITLKHEIDNLTNEIELLQEKILEDLDVSEVIQSQLDQVKEFLKNSEESLSEISKEANLEISKQNLLIDDRIIVKLEHIELLTLHGKELYLATEKNSNNKNYFSSIDAARNCARCGSNVDSETRETAEKQEIITSCPSCSNLFVFR